MYILYILCVLQDEFRAQTRTGGIYSGLGSSDDYRALTSIAYSAEPPIHADVVTAEIERPENNLWVIEADSPDLHNKLINAVVHGK